MLLIYTDMSYMTNGLILSNALSWLSSSITTKAAVIVSFEFRPYTSEFTLVVCHCTWSWQVSLSSYSFTLCSEKNTHSHFL